MQKQIDEKVLGGFHASKPETSSPGNFQKYFFPELVPSRWGRSM